MTNYIDDEYKVLLDFQEKLEEVIKLFPHEEGTYITNEKRYNDAMKALFGDVYTTPPKTPSHVSEEEFEEIIKQWDETGNLEGSIKNVIKKKLSENYSDSYNAMVATIKKQIRRNKVFYTWQKPSSSEFDK